MHFTTLALFGAALLGENSLAKPLDIARSHSLSLTDRLHRSAIKRTHGIANDIRVALNGVFSDPPANRRRSRKLERRSSGKSTCVVKTNSTVNAAGSGASVSVSQSASASRTASSGTATGGTATATKTSPSATSISSATSTSSATSDFTISQSYAGSDFWDKWNFFTAADPTNGIVNYLSQSDAESAGLISVTSNGSAIMKVETTQIVPNNRKSVRIQSQAVFNGGLVIMDATHMPTGCGVWPAFWTNGPNWPATGEIDIVEGVNAYTENQATIHTGSGCTLSSSGLNSLISGVLVGETNCDAEASNNQGCGIRSDSSKSFGSGFNSVGGGVYAMLWADDGVSVWFFQRGSIPSDIGAEAPTPSGWGTPMAFWSGDSCNPSSFFKDHSAIFDTTLCGDWASGVWGTANVAGQSQSCAASTGVSTCVDYVRNNGNAFSEAYWEVNSVKIYQQK